MPGGFQMVIQILAYDGLIVANGKLKKNTQMITRVVSYPYPVNVPWYERNKPESAREALYHIIRQATGLDA